MSPNADLVGRYRWDWVNNGDIEYVDGTEQRFNESYVVRRPDGQIFCTTNRYKLGYERAIAIADAMNATLSHIARSATDG